MMTDQQADALSAKIDARLSTPSAAQAQQGAAVSPYTVDGAEGRFRLRRNGCVMRDNGQFPPCACCHPGDPMLDHKERLFKTASEAWAAADRHEQRGAR